jgi:small-conductance mechanosensitive channel
VLIGVAMLGPPIGGILMVFLTQFLPALTAGQPQPLAELIPALGLMLLSVVPLSYVVGGQTAVLAGLALAAFVAWGGRLTVWACLAAALIHPALIAIVAAFDSRGTEPETLRSVLTYTAILGIISAISAAICYFVLRNTWFMRDATKPPAAAVRDGAP